MTMPKPAMTFGELKANVDQFFLLYVAAVALFMQCGFAFLEAGAVRSKNCTHMLCKNILDTIVCSIAFWIFGYAFAFGTPGNRFIGYGHFVLHGMDEGKMAFFMFHMSFAATASTIVSGALAGRCGVVSYMIYSFFVSGFIYPVVAHWSWGPGGFLSQGEQYVVQNGTHIFANYQDFAGSGVVHTTGGICALIGCVFLGPRLGKFETDENGKTYVARLYRGHSLPLMCMGGFILVLGWLALNAGSQLHISSPGDGAVIGLATVNTVIAASSSGITTLIFHRLTEDHKWQLLPAFNGAFCAMAAVGAGCNIYYPWTSVVVGVVAAIIYGILSRLMLRLRIDDPVNAISVHLGGGVWGVVAVALLKRETGVLFLFDRASGISLGWQMCGLLVICMWSAGTAFILFYSLNWTELLRVDPEIEKEAQLRELQFDEVTEEQGMDKAIHGEDAYPIEAYGHGWIEDLPMWFRDMMAGRKPKPELEPHAHTE